MLFSFRKRYDGRPGLVQDLLGRGRRLRDARVRPHGHLHQLRQAARRVPNLQAVRRPSCEDF